MAQNQNIFGKLRELGFKTCPEDFYGYVDLWKSWYDGDVEKFHHYKVYNGQKKIKCDRYGLGMAKKVCEDWANLLLTEKVKVTLEGDAEQEFFNQVCQDNNFEVKSNEQEELTFFGGTTSTIVRAVDVPVNQETGGVTGTGRLVLDYAHMPNIYPLSWENGKIIECAFATHKVDGEDKYLYVQIHRLNEQKTYDIENYLFRDNQGSLTQVELSTVADLADVAEKVHTQETERMFVINRPNIVNNIDPSLPLGISVYANAIPQLKGCDIAYDTYVNEMVTGKKRVVVKAEALQNVDGEPTFDPDDVVFYALPEDSSAGAEATMIQPLDMSLRTPQLNAAIQDMLNMLSARCGFGENHYKFNNGGVATATQIVSENSTLFRTIKKHEIVLEGMLKELARIILRMGNLYCGQHLNPDVEITVDFDDSIIENKDVDFQRDAAMVSMGILNPWEFRAKWMNESEETAKAALPQMDALAGLVEDGTENNPPANGKGAQRPTQPPQRETEQGVRSAGYPDDREEEEDGTRNRQRANGRNRSSAQNNRGVARNQ